MKKRYTIKDVLAAKGVHIEIKKHYTEKDVLRAKRHLSDVETGACFIFDRQHSTVARWLDRSLRKLNMAWIQGSLGWAKVVRLDDTKPLPENYGLLVEGLWVESGELYNRLRETGRIKKDFFGGLVLKVGA